MSSETQVASVSTETLPEAPAKIESTWTSFVPMILIFVVFYFFLIRPQEKRRKEHEKLITSVKKGEEILTTGGIVGKVTKVSDSEPTIMVEIADNTIVKVSKSAVSDILSRKAASPVAASSASPAPAAVEAKAKEETKKAPAAAKKKTATKK